MFNELYIVALLPSGLDLQTRVGILPLTKRFLIFSHDISYMFHDSFLFLAMFSHHLNFVQRTSTPVHWGPCCEDWAPREYK